MLAVFALIGIVQDIRVDDLISLVEALLVELVCFMVVQLLLGIVNICHGQTLRGT